MSNFHIAIDGPVAAGKGTVSRLIAEQLNFVYIDTGAMYRMTAFLANRKGIDWKDEKSLVKMLVNAKMDMRAPIGDEKDGRLVTIFLNGEDVSWKIRTEAVSRGSSIVAVLPDVRKALVKKQQEVAKNKNIVMEGRDITYRVLPDANLKIFLTGADVVRAKRRHLQLLTKGINANYQEVLSDLNARDEQDSNRVVDPLQIVDDAWVVDTSDLSIQQVVALIVNRALIMMEQME